MRHRRDLQTGGQLTAERFLGKVPDREPDPLAGLLAGSLGMAKVYPTRIDKITGLLEGRVSWERLSVESRGMLEVESREGRWLHLCEVTCWKLNEGEAAVAW